MLLSEQSLELVSVRNKQKLNVCLSSRLQRGYNGVERAEFQHRE
jgi:hypothetical protein